MNNEKEHADNEEKEFTGEELKELRKDIRKWLKEWQEEGIIQIYRDEMGKVTIRFTGGYT